MIELIQLIIMIPLGFMSLYLVLLSILAFGHRNKVLSSARSVRKFAIVIPAHNEADCIGCTLAQLSTLDYPDHLYDLIVIADNCSDPTARIAKERGAIVWARTDQSKKGKGYALRWAFDRILLQSEFTEKPYDSVVVLDADSHVEPNILQVFNRYRESGAEVIQGFLGVPPNPDSWTTESIRIGLTLYNYIRPLGRKRLGLPSGLRGNGMCFSIHTLRQVPWNAFGQTEDLEYGLELLLKGVDVTFAPETIGYNRIPERAETAESQRERWEMGRIPVLRQYAGKLAIASVRDRSLRIADALIDLVTPPLVTTVLFMLMMASLNAMLWWSGVTDSGLFTGLWLLLALSGSLHALIGLAAAGVDRRTYSSLLHVPKYAIWKLLLYLKIMFVKGRTTSWVRTARE